MSTASIPALPLEIWHEITRCLTKIELIGLRQTCSSLQWVADSYLFNDLSVNVSSPSTVSWIARGLESPVSLGPCFTIPRRLYLFVTWNDRQTEVDVDSRGFEDPEVTVLKFGQSYAARFLQALVSLREIEIHLCFAAKESEAVVPLLEAVVEKHAGSVYYIQCASLGCFGPMLRKMTNLRTLVLKATEGCDNKYLSEALDVMPLLEFLVLSVAVDDDEPSKFDELFRPVKVFKPAELQLVGPQLPTSIQTLKKLRNIRLLMVDDYLPKAWYENERKLEFWNTVKEAGVAPRELVTLQMNQSLLDYLQAPRCRTLTCLNIRIPTYWEDWSYPGMTDLERYHKAGGFGDQFYAKVVPSLLSSGLEELNVLFTNFRENYPHISSMWHPFLLRRWTIEWPQTKGYVYLEKLYRSTSLRRLSIMAILEHGKTNAQLEGALDALAVLMRRCEKLMEVKLCLLHQQSTPMTEAVIHSHIQAAEHVRKRIAAWEDRRLGIPEGRRLHVSSRTHTVMEHQGPRQSLSSFYIDLAEVESEFISREGKWIRLGSGSAT